VSPDDPGSLTIDILRPATARASGSCLMLDCAHVINFLIIIIISDMLWYHYFIIKVNESNISVIECIVNSIVFVE